MDLPESLLLGGRASDEESCGREKGKYLVEYMWLEAVRRGFRRHREYAQLALLSGISKLPSPVRVWQIAVHHHYIEFKCRGI